MPTLTCRTLYFIYYIWKCKAVKLPVFLVSVSSCTPCSVCVLMHNTILACNRVKRDELLFSRLPILPGKLYCKGTASIGDVASTQLL